MGGMGSLLLICGIDEAGRGPWAGPVTAACVILDVHNPIEGLADSKKLSEKRRDFLAIEIKRKAKYWSIANASVEEIDSLNIRAATFLAMQRAVEGLPVAPDLALIDGNATPKLEIEARAIIGGDGKEPSISAASILAKTKRDAIMKEIDSEFPVYGFASHKGYGTSRHSAALCRHGACRHHRKTFAPVRRVIKLSEQALENSTTICNR